MDSDFRKNCNGQQNSNVKAKVCRELARPVDAGDDIATNADGEGKEHKDKLKKTSGTNGVNGHGCH